MGRRAVISLDLWSPDRNSELKYVNATHPGRKPPPMHIAPLKGVLSPDSLCRKLFGATVKYNRAGTHIAPGIHEMVECERIWLIACLSRVCWITVLRGVAGRIPPVGIPVSPCNYGHHQNISQSSTPACLRVVATLRHVDVPRNTSGTFERSVGASACPQDPSRRHRCHFAPP